MSPPSEVKAIVTTASGTPKIQTVSLPTLREREDYILVRTTAVALNPIDWKRGKGTDGPSRRLGCDYAGVVEEVGSKVTKQFSRGDRICGVVNGGNAANLEDGTFAEYTVVKGDVQIKIPDNLSDEEAATLGVGVTTVGQGLYQSLQLPLPSSTATGTSPTDKGAKRLLFIYGGSTATGLLGIQFATLSGYTVLTTSSPANFAYVKSLGAALVVDYRSPSSAIAEVKDWMAAHAGDEPLTKAWDCVGGKSSSTFCASVLANPPPNGKELQYSAIIGVDEPLVKSINPSVQGVKYTIAFTALGEALGGKSGPFAMPAVEEDFEFAKGFWELSKRLLEDGRIRPARVDVNRNGKGGLEGVLDGMREMEEGKVSGIKLVYTL